jgi:hypothetical protein
MPKGERARREKKELTFKKKLLGVLFVYHKKKVLL